MKIGPGHFEILGIPKGLLALSYSLCFDDPGEDSSGRLALKHAALRRGRPNVAGVSINRLQRDDADWLTFEGVVRTWDALACRPRFISGRFNIQTSMGQCEIGPTVAL